MKELAEDIVKLLASMLNWLPMIICNLQVNCKYLDFTHLQVVTYPDQVNRPDVDERNYADFQLPMNFNGDSGIRFDVVGSHSNDMDLGLDGDTSEDKLEKPAVMCNYCGKNNPELKCCLRCKSIFYCGRTCQKKAHNHHKEVCLPKDRISLE